MQDYKYGAAHRTFAQVIAQLPLFSGSAVLKLRLDIRGHAFPPLVLHLLDQIRPVKALNVGVTNARKVNIQSVLLLTKILLANSLLLLLLMSCALKNENYRH